MGGTSRAPHWRHAGCVPAPACTDGTQLNQADYFKLIYSPEHHHFVRHFGVLFDTPVDGTCGLKW